MAIWKQVELVTFYGPALLTDFAEHPAMFDFTRTAFLDAVTLSTPLRPMASASEWSDELLDWGEKRDLERPRTRMPSRGWTWLKPGVGHGVLLGGCIESLQHLRGTRFWPEWRNAILFFEASNAKPDVLDGILMDYENMGVLGEISGMLVGRSWGYTASEHEGLREVVRARTARFKFPIVMDMDFGHTAPQLTLPIGCLALIDTDARRVEFLEKAVV
jgi:muramoyltetrapeptide carboxypeptidase LdcA involved in peptidoglycan recycling